MKIQLHTVELHSQVRGPGPRSQGDLTGTFTIEKARIGDIPEGESKMKPTGLAIVWDQEHQAVYLVNDTTKQEPVVIIPWKDVKRALPLEGLNMPMGQQKK